MVTQNIKKIASGLFVLRLFRMSLSMVSLILSAKFFGVSMERDMWVLVTAFIMTLGSALWGPVNETFRAKFIFISESDGKDKALSSAFSLVVFIILITLLLSFIIGIFHDSLGHLLSVSGKSSEGLQLFSLLLIVMLPTLLITQLTSIGISILNAYDIYYLPEIAGGISSIFNILIIILLAPRIGIFSLAISQYMAMGLLLVGVLYYLHKLHVFHLKDIFLVDIQGFWAFFAFSLPFFFPYLVRQVNAFSEKWLAGWLGEGVISSLDYARQFTVVLQSVISSVLTTVMLPLLAKAYAQNDANKYQNIFKENLNVCFCILALAIPILVGAASPLCEFFFQHGKVSFAALEVIVSLTRYYGISFIAVLLYMLIGYALLASNQGKKYAFWGVLVQIIVLCLNVSLIHLLDVYVFPVALGIAHLIGAAMMSVVLLVYDKRNLYLSVIRYICVVIVLSTVLYIFNHYVNSFSVFVRLLLNILLLLCLIIVSSSMLDIHIFTYIQKIKNRLCRNN